MNQSELTETSLLTLVGQPFSQLHVLRAGTQGQEVSPHVQRSILLLEEILRSVGVVDTGAINGLTRGEGRRVGNGSRPLGSWRGRSLGWASVLLVVSTTAKALTTNPQRKMGHVSTMNPDEIGGVIRIRMSGAQLRGTGGGGMSRRKEEKRRGNTWDTTKRGIHTHSERR